MVRSMLLALGVWSTLLIGASAFVPQARPRWQQPAATTARAPARRMWPAAASLKPVLEQLVADPTRDLTEAQTKEAFGAILEGADPVQVGALLLLLRAKGETGNEIAGMAAAMKDACAPVTLAGKLLDIVGTGGDGASTINISTAAAILAAAAGCKVAKAGNRSVSSMCGSADVLEALGVSMKLTPEQMAACVEEANIGFLFAPVNHPAMKLVAPVRGALGMRTVFNVLGPMTNAAGAQHVVIGVFHEELISLMADSLEAIGNVEHGVVIHGVGLDEISPLGPCTVLEIKNTAPPGAPRVYERNEFSLDPLDYGVPRCTLEDLKGGEPAENVKLLKEALAAGPHTDAKRDAIVLNAAMGAYVYGLAPTVGEAMQLVRGALESGAATATLERWVATTQRLQAA